MSLGRVRVLGRSVQYARPANNYFKVVIPPQDDQPAGSVLILLFFSADPKDVEVTHMRALARAEAVEGAEVSVMVRAGGIVMRQVGEVDEKKLKASARREADVEACPEAGGEGCRGVEDEGDIVDLDNYRKANACVDPPAVAVQ